MIMDSNEPKDNVLFGENIDKSLYEDSMIETVKKMKSQNKSVYEKSAEKEMEPKPDKYIFITIYSMHASIVIVDKELFDTLFFEPTWGQMIEGAQLSLNENSEAIRRLATTTPLQQYHITLDDDGRYILARNMYYIPWLMKSRSFYVGETAMAYLYLQMLSLQVLPRKYRLLLDDCLEFAKRFAREVARRENGVRETEIQVLFRTLKVSEHYSMGTVEQKSRNNQLSGLTAALSYFTSFKLERFVTIIIVLAALAVYMYYTSSETH